MHISQELAFPGSLLGVTRHNSSKRFHLKLYMCRCIMVIVIAQLHSTKPELRFCAGSNPARGVSEIRDGEDL